MSEALLMLGLPETGKSTYLAALWHIALHALVPGSLRIERHSGDQQYLAEIHDDWVNCRKVARTPATAQETVRLRVTLADRTLELVIPDLSGELLVGYLEARQWPQSFQEMVDAAVATLLFVNPSVVTEPAWIFDIHAPAGEPEQTAATESAAQDEVPEPWSIRKSPTQVQMVDMLQLIRRPDRSVPLAVVVSAWDLLAADYNEPGEWLTDRMPLLDQFLACNIDSFPHQLFGVSAQGGHLPDERQRLLEMDPSKKVLVVPGPSRGCSFRINSSVARNDITAPVRWLMGAAEQG